MDRDSVVSARKVHDLIADGHTIVIYKDYVLRLDSWLDKHPGGRLSILHMVGRDATDEIDAYHRPVTLKTMKAFRIGLKPPGIWTNTTPPIRGGVYKKRQGTDTVDDVSDSEDSLLSETVASLFDSSISSSLASLTSNESDIDRLSVKDKATPILKMSQRDPDDPLSAETMFTGSPAAFTDWAENQDIDRDLREYPSVCPAVQQEIARKYKTLHQRVHDEGFYDCPYLEYGKEMARYTSLFAAFIVALRCEWYMSSAFFLGLFWHQIMFTAHDAGHRAITGIFEVDTLIGMFVGDFCCGLSIGWWKSSHNVHHLVTNHPEHDPDIQNVPLFATTPTFFRSINSTYYGDFIFAWDAVANFMVPYQKYTYYPIMGIARFNLYLLSWLHVLSAKSSSLGNTKAWWIRPVEITFMSCYWYIFGYLLLWRTLPTWGVRVAFVLVSHIVTMPLHVQITLSHWAMSTSDLGEDESFAQRQLRTTMDVDCPAWLDFIHGGLQFQAVHHLFPRVPRHNLRRLQKLVKEFCAETEIPYTLLGFVDGNDKVLCRLDEVGQQVKHLINCQKYMAETGESGLH
ncbi:fatty acid desaturase-domain-containing protein [Echria macrotheca]|uniref:Delta 8-(E)-sphingolipid desaturase n=1 Tax=Echria macrotheca TaxID=438768 RepID=A0AAJ0B4G1_9PEZI|nr:fatty acid desaturase-domain-containing protein [Echria macrotheca]